MSEKYASLVILTPQSDRCCPGGAEVRILDFTTTWSEFQIPSQTTFAEAKLRYICSILKSYGQSSRSPVKLLPRKAKPNYVYSISNPHGQSFKRPVRLLLCESKLSYIYSILKPPGQTAAEPGEAEPGILNSKTT